MKTWTFYDVYVVLVSYDNHYETNDIICHSVGHILIIIHYEKTMPQGDPLTV